MLVILFHSLTPLYLCNFIFFSRLKQNKKSKSMSQLSIVRLYNLLYSVE